MLFLTSLSWIWLNLLLDQSESELFDFMWHWFWLQFLRHKKSGPSSGERIDLKKVNMEKTIKPKLQILKYYLLLLFS